MNPQCSICLSPAPLVCSHPQCQFPPFVCQTQCISQASSLMHSHKKNPQLIPFLALQTKIHQLSQSPVSAYIQQVSKRVRILQESLTHALQKHIDLIKSLEPKIKQPTKEIIDKVNCKSEHKALTGEDINKLMTQKEMYEMNKKDKIFYDELVSDFADHLLKLQTLLQDPTFIFQSSQPDFLQKVAQKNYTLALQLSQQGSFLQSLQKLQISTEINPNQQKYNLELFACYQKLQNQEKLFECGSHLINCGLQDISKFSEIKHKLGKIWMKRGMYEEAIECFDLAMNFGGDEVENNRWRAGCCWKIGRYEDAEAGYQLIMFVDGERAEFYEERAEMYEAMGEKEKAKKDREEAEKIRNQGK